MSNLINFFFSFDKLMKEKLVIAFYWLAIIVGGMNFLSEALRSIRLGPLATLIDIIIFFGTILLSLVTLRLLSEIAVAIFRINNNLSPDGGTSETANIDPIAEARRAAENAANAARDMSKSAVDRTKTAAGNAKDSVGEFADSTVEKTKSVTRRGDKVKTTSPEIDPQVAKDMPDLVDDGSVSVVGVEKVTPKPKSTLQIPAAQAKPAAGTAKPKVQKTTGKKRGPKPGTKARRNADGVRLKKDGTPAKKPGPKA